MYIKLELIFIGHKIKLIECIIIRVKLRIELEERRKWGRKISNLKKYMS